MMHNVFSEMFEIVIDVRGNNHCKYHCNTYMLCFGELKPIFTTVAKVEVSVKDLRSGI